MRAVDTNVLVRLLARDDPKQVTAAEAFVAKGAWVSHIVLVEAFWVLDSVFEVRRPELARGVEMLLNHRDLTVQDPDVVQAALERFKAHPRIDFSDCMILETARRVGHLPLGTFDRHLAKLDDTEPL